MFRRDDFLQREKEFFLQRDEEEKRIFKQREKEEKRKRD